MNAVDWIIVAAILISVVMAASQGFFFEMVSLAGVIFGYMLASWEYHYLGDCLGFYVKNAWAGEIAGFVILFLLIEVAAVLVARLAGWAMYEGAAREVVRVL